MLATLKHILCIRKKKQEIRSKKIKRSGYHGLAACHFVTKFCRTPHTNKCLKSLKIALTWLIYTAIIFRASLFPVRYFSLHGKHQLCRISNFRQLVSLKTNHPSFCFGKVIHSVLFSFSFSITSLMYKPLLFRCYFHTSQTTNQHLSLGRLFNHGQ